MLLLYFLFWIIFNGAISLEICLFGAVIALCLFAFSCRFLDYSVKKELAFYRKSGVMANYIVLLVWEIIKANLGVIRLILTQKEEIEPALVCFETDLKTSLAKTLLANAITLTPGTITVTLDGSTYWVHCLDKELAEGIENSPFRTLLKRLEQ